jgi:hypothetical protein
MENVRSLLKVDGHVLVAESIQIPLQTQPLSDPSVELPRLHTADEIVLVTSSKSGSPPSGLVESLQSALLIDGSVPRFHVLESSTPSDFAGNICVFLGEIPTPLLRDVDAITLNAIKSMTINSNGVLWITRGGTIKCQNPDFALAWGFLRSLRNEYIGRRFLSLDFDPEVSVWSEDNISAISRVLKFGFGSSSNPASPTRDFEYAVRNGVFKIPRILKDRLRNEIVTPIDATEADTTMELLHQPGRPLRMHVGMPGLLDTVSFCDDDPESMDPGSSIPPRIIEVDPRAYGVNFRDVIVAIGQLHKQVIGLECAGIVTRAGSDAVEHSYSVRDCVFCLLRGPFGSCAYTEWTNVAHMPDCLSFEEAALLPVVFSTAYICLTTLAYLEPGNTILIHSGAGGVG